MPCFTHSVWFLVTQRLKLGRFLITIQTDIPLLIDVLYAGPCWRPPLEGVDVLPEA